MRVKNYCHLNRKLRISDEYIYTQKYLCIYFTYLLIFNRRVPIFIHILLSVHKNAKLEN